MVSATVVVIVAVMIKPFIHYTQNMSSYVHGIQQLENTRTHRWPKTVSLLFSVLYPKPDIKYCYSGLVQQWITVQRAKFVEADCWRSTLLLRPKSTSR